jgi:2-keto-4-pentenoate hydratase/2-oxohepta-3-ene-1,7-dioic acid hydratase in catechol pathway
MKLTRFYQQGRIIPGVFQDENTVLDLNTFGEDWNEVFFASDGIFRLEQWIRNNTETLPKLNADSLRLAPAICRPSKIICIGLNYADHAEESGMDKPSEPVVFFKATTAWCGPNDDLVIPKGSEKTDWEVELAVVIGKQAVMFHKVRRWIMSQGLPCIMIIQNAPGSLRGRASGSKGNQRIRMLPLGLI